MRPRIIIPSPDPNAAQEETSKRQNDGRWQRGTSGNPSGKPPGTRNRLLRELDALGDEVAVNMVRRIAWEGIFNGDMRALEILARRVWPERKGRPIELALPDIRDIGDLQKANAAVTAAMARGEISPEEAAIVAGVLNGQSHTQEIAAIKDQLNQLQEQMNALARSN
jgi:hypothetical protein